MGTVMGRMNIKDPALIAEAKALAGLLGTNTPEAIRRAMHERLGRENLGRDAERRQRFDAIMAIAEPASKLFPPGTTGDHADLYDENGFPK
jgi:antitoxin VapB